MIHSHTPKGPSEGRKDVADPFDDLRSCHLCPLVRHLQPPPLDKKTLRIASAPFGDPGRPFLPWDFPVSRPL
jgi:hypothetical protein